MQTSVLPRHQGCGLAEEPHGALRGSPVPAPVTPGPLIPVHFPAPRDYFLNTWGRLGVHQRPPKDRT